MKGLTIIYFLLLAHTSYAQNSSLTFTNPKNAYYNKNYSKQNLNESKINEIILKNDSTFEFWSRPEMSCFMWHEYKGKYIKEKDSVYFYDNYEVVENNIKGTYKCDSSSFYHLRFKSELHSDLKNKQIKIQYVYDLDSQLADTGGMVSLPPDNTLDIPFSLIPHLNKLTAIRIDYDLDSGNTISNYLTPNIIVNRKMGELPNIINVVFVDHPKKETVYRTIKGVIQNKTLIIISTFKSKINIPDQTPDIQFEDKYALTP